VYIEHPLVNGSGLPSFSTCHCTPTLKVEDEGDDEEEEVASTTKVKVGGREDATRRRWERREGLPVKGEEYCVSSYYLMG